MKRIKKALAIVLSFVLLVTILPIVNNGHTTKAATGFAIISPSDNALVAAGYFDIEWNAATGNVTDYEVYFDGELQGATKDTVYECYTTKVAMHSAYIVAKMSDGSKQTSDELKFGVSKKGLGLGQDMGANIDLKDMGCSWYYNWGTGPSAGDQYRGVEFVPMQWGNDSYANIDRKVTGWADKGYKYALAFNEPDLQGQGVTSVNDAVNRWPAFINHGLRVGSPASFLWPKISSWLKDFMIRIDNNVDFITIHCYPENNPGFKQMADWFLEEVVDSAWEMYHKPIWITEFSTADTTPGKTSVTAQGTAEFWAYVMEGLDEREYVERYAGFCFNTSGNPGTGLWNYYTGELSLGGEVYRAYGNPEGYEPGPTVESDYKTEFSVGNDLIPDTATINKVVCEDYVNQPGVTATATTKNGNNSDADKAIDASITTRWESKHGIDPQALTIDLGQVRNIKQIGINWESAAAKTYTIDVSTDGDTWTTVALIEEGKDTQHRLDTTTLKEMAQGRYVRINGTERATNYGYSIWDVAIYGTDDVKVDETTTQEPTTKRPKPTFPEYTTEPKPLQTTTVAKTENTTTASDTTTAVEKPSNDKEEENSSVYVAPSKVKKASKKLAATRAKVTLKKVKGATGYQVRVYKSKKAKKALVKKTVKKVKFTLKKKKLKNKKKLYIQVRVYKVVNGKKNYSVWSKKKKIRIKK